MYFYDIDVRSKPLSGFDYATCTDMIKQILAAMQTAMSSGVAEYHVGSRGLKRYTITDLQGMLTFWMWAQQAALFGQQGMIARRVIPMDV